MKSVLWMLLLCAACTPREADPAAAPTNASLSAWSCPSTLRSVGASNSIEHSLAASIDATSKTPPPEKTSVAPCAIWIWPYRVTGARVQVSAPGQSKSVEHSLADTEQKPSSPRISV